MKKEHFLALADGRIFFGDSCGAEIDACGEAVFNTGMTGYQEIVSDPSYAGQFVTLCTAEVGNYGCCKADMESRGVFLNGLVVQQMNPPSNFRSETSLSELLRSAGKPALANVDTRGLVLHLRDLGVQKAYLHCSAEKITPEEGVERARNWEGLEGFDYASRVSSPEPFDWTTKGDLTVAVYDFGVKYNILRQLADAGFRVRVVPAGISAEEVLAGKPDAVFLSNGPGDPAGVRKAVANVKQLIGKLPVMGICLGHQIIGLACGGECRKLKFGHHGCNHPVRNLLDGTVEITSQNHNYALDVEKMPSCLEPTHRNLNDGTIEGVRHRTEPVFCVQYHPESAPGPHDSRYLFRQFRQLVER